MDCISSLRAAFVATKQSLILWEIALDRNKSASQHLHRAAFGAVQV